MARSDDDEEIDGDDEDATSRGSDKRIKKVKSVLIDPESPDGKRMYKMLHEVIKRHRPDLHEAEVNIALAFRSGWKADADGRVPYGKFKIHSELDVQLSQYSGCMELNQEMWETPTFTIAQREGWMHHFLCYARVAIDNDGEPKVNNHGWVILKKRNPDTVVFNDNIALFGYWHQGLTKTYNAFQEAQSSPLLSEIEKVKKANTKGVPRIHQA